MSFVPRLLLAASLLALGRGPALAHAPHAASAPRHGRAAPSRRSVRRGGDAAAKTIVFSKGSANWDSAFDTLVEAFKNVYGALQKQGLKPPGRR
jgi:hypothetical protein